MSMPRVSRRAHGTHGKVLTAEERSRPDHGADGPAMRSRPSRIIETKDAGVTTRLMARARDYPLDHYEDGCLLTERQLNAGRRLGLLYAIGFGFPVLVARLVSSGGTLSDTRTASQTSCRRQYGEAMERVPASARETICRIVRGEFPKQLHALDYVRAGLDAVADLWQLPRA